MSVDYKRAWEIAKATAPEFHAEDCPYRTMQGAIICNCHVLNEHPEQKDAENIYTKGGAVLEKNPPRKSIILADWCEISQREEAGKELDPIERFIYNYDDADPNGSKKWIKDLTAALEYAVNDLEFYEGG